mgnify:CR=1 FL=1
MTRERIDTAIKCAALAAMTIDHAARLHLDGAALAAAFSLGRTAAPAFMALIALRLAQRPQREFTYLHRLIPWALAAVPVYGLAKAVMAGQTLSSTAAWLWLGCGNILVTLALGVAAAAALRRGRTPGRAAVSAALAAAALPLAAHVSYGLAGVLAVPVLTAVARHASGAAYGRAVAAAAVAINAPAGTAAVCASLPAALVLAAVFHHRAAAPSHPGHTPPAHQAAYAYYPAHLALLTATL